MPKAPARTKAARKKTATKKVIPSKVVKKATKKKKRVNYIRGLVNLTETYLVDDAPLHRGLRITFTCDAEGYESVQATWRETHNGMKKNEVVRGHPIRLSVLEDACFYIPRVGPKEIMKYLEALREKLPMKEE